MDHTEEGDEEVTSTSASASAVAVLWEDLPRDLVASIVSWLPVATILRSRTVSKNFHAWLTSVSFLDEIARLPSRSSWLVIFPASNPSTACAFDPSLASWLALPIPLPIQPLASSRGLICAVPRPDRDLHTGVKNEFLVCNLVTRSWVTIPRPRELSKFFFLVVGMIASGRSGFTIVVAGSELMSHESATFKLSAWIYDSRSSKWCRGSSVMIDAAISTSSAVSGGKLFVLSGNRELLAYDLERGSWSRVDLPAGREELSSVKLLDRFGRLVIAARSGPDEISLWELDHGHHPAGMETKLSSSEEDRRWQWRELGRMPRFLSSELLQSRRFACVGSGDEAYFASAKCGSILGYTFPTKRWRWIRCCPAVTKNPHYDLLRGICLEARLETNPGSTES